MSSKDGLGYSVGKIFITLFVLTAIEVAWGMFFRDPRWFLWSGLLVCALLKGGLIFMYFMHMKYERFLLWALVLPTPLLVMVIFGYVTPDASFNHRRDYANGMMMNHTGQIVPMSDMIREAHGEHGGATTETHEAAQGAEQSGG